MATTPNDLIVRVRTELDERSIEGIWFNADLLQWCNDGIQKTLVKLRANREDWLTRKMGSTDASETILGATYSPLSIDFSSGVDTYTLPADCMEIRSIEPSTQSDKDAGVTFLPRDITDVEYLAAARLPSSSNRRVYYYDVIGLTNLRLTPVPGANYHINLYYVAAPPTYTQFDNITIIPLWAMRAVVSYMKYRAFDSINHPDTKRTYQQFEVELIDVGSFGAPRKSQEPIIVEGFFDSDDIVNIADTDPV